MLESGTGKVTAEEVLFGDFFGGYQSAQHWSLDLALAYAR